MALLEIVLLLFLFFEVFYFLRFIIVALYLKVMKWQGGLSKSPFSDGVVYGVCTTNDLDFLCHMSNSRYSRELDFGRIIFFVKNGMFTTLRNSGGDVALAALTIRYRRSITLFQVFKIHTKIIYWEDRNLYLEQKMETVQDKFIRAVAYVKVVLVNYSSWDNLFKVLGHPQTSPMVAPPDLINWIKYNELSSKSLQSERAVNDKNKNDNNGPNKTEADICSSAEDKKQD